VTLRKRLMVRTIFWRYENKHRPSDRPLDLGLRSFERGSSDRHSFITSLLVRVSTGYIRCLARRNKKRCERDLLLRAIFSLEKIMEDAKLGPEISDV
jgi:hypothetical protein